MSKLVERPSLCFWLILVGSMLLYVSTALVKRADLSPERLEVDEFQYYTEAGAFAQGIGELHTSRVVGHPLLIAALRKGFGDRLLPIQLAVSAIASLTAPLAYLLARRELRDARTAAIAGVGVMLWPPFVWYGTTLYSESVALPLFVAFLLAMPGPRTIAASRSGRWFGAGMILGLCMHYRAMYLIYSPLAAWLAYCRAGGGRAGLARAAILAAGSLVVVVPWSIFMSIREGTPVLLTTQGGAGLSGGLNSELIRIEREQVRMEGVARSGRQIWTGPGKWLDVNSSGFLSPEEVRLPAATQNRILTQRTLAWISTHRADAAYLSWRKLLYMWGFYPFWNGWSLTIFGNIPVVILLPTAVAALVGLRGYLRTLALLWTLPLFSSVVALLTWGSWRFRQPGDLGLILLAATLFSAAQVRSALASDQNRDGPTADAGCTREGRVPSPEGQFS
jgi:hypothetical protein